MGKCTTKKDITCHINITIAQKWWHKYSITFAWTFPFMARKFTSLMTVEQVMWLFYFKEMCFSTSSPKLVVNGMEIWYDFKIILQIHRNLINQGCSWWECGRITMYTYIILLGINNNAEWDRVAHICFTKLTSIGRHRAIIWINAGKLLIAPLAINFGEILIATKIGGGG